MGTSFVFAHLIVAVAFVFFRLRMIARRLEKEDITKEDLKKNLEYAASVLETVYIDEAR